MSRLIEAHVVGYQGERFGPHSATRWQVMYQEPGGSIVGADSPVYVKPIGPLWPDVIDIDRQASVNKRAAGILTDDGKVLLFVPAVPHLGPCPGDSGGGGGGGTPPAPGVPIPPGIQETPVLPPGSGGTGSPPSAPEGGGGI